MNNPSPDESTQTLNLPKLDPMSKDHNQSHQQDHTPLSPQSLEELTDLISHAGINLNLDIFRIDQLLKSKNTMINICMEIYEKNGIIEGLGTSRQTMMQFLQTVQSYYINNYYHNNLHAADVTNTITWLLNECGVSSMISKTELYAMIIGATVHDIGHPGFNNPF